MFICLQIYEKSPRQQKKEPKKAPNPKGKEGFSFSIETLETVETLKR